MPFTQLELAQASNVAFIRQQVDSLNANARSAYLTEFSGWLTNWNAGRVADKSTAPAPPKAYIVGWFNDPTTGPGMVGGNGETVLQWSYPALGSTPVCEQPEIPEMPAPQSSIAIPAPVYQVGDVMNCPADDPWPVGHVLTDPSNGAQYTKKSHGNPFSPTRVVFFYERTK